MTTWILVIYLASGAAIEQRPLRRRRHLRRRRRSKHTDPRTTARHYEVRIDAVPGKLPGRGTRG